MIEDKTCMFSRINMIQKALNRIPIVEYNLKKNKKMKKNVAANDILLRLSLLCWFSICSDSFFFSYLTSINFNLYNNQN